MSSDNVTGLALIRRALEEHSAVDDGPKLLFEALSELPPDEDLPKTAEQVSHFLTGPLGKVLFERLSTLR